MTHRHEVPVGGSRFLPSVFWLALVALLLCYALRPIMDLDFWWHLKTGEVILGQRGLLSIDPFNYTGNVAVQGREAVILNGYWLWQTIAAGLFSLWGFNGIFLLKIVTIGLIGGTLYRQMQQQQLARYTRIGLITLGTAVIVTVYNLERPQVFSIVFITLLLGMISRIRAGHRPSRMLWPMMVLWANIHGGFVVGDILLALAAAGFLIQYRHDGRLLRSLLLWVLVAVLASFVNPNGWNAFRVAFDFMSDSLGPAFVVEYRSSWFLFSNISRVAALCLWVIAVLHLAGLAATPRRYWPEILTSLFLLAFGLKYIRNAGFIAVSLLPVTGWYLEQSLDRCRERLPRQGRLIIGSVAFILVAWLLVQEGQRRRTAAGPIAGSLPVAMAGFLKDSGLAGNLFNEYGVGGFLAWSLYPQWKTFIDGRELDTRVSRHYLQIALASQEVAEGRRLYELLLDRYRIDVIAMRTTISSGNLQPLLRVLLPDPDWVPVFHDRNTFVLVRTSAANAAAIKRYGIDKTLFVEELARTAAPALYNDLAALQRELALPMRLD